MNRRETLKATGASVLAGTALVSSVTASDRGKRNERRSGDDGNENEDGPTVVTAELERSDEDKTDEYTVRYNDELVEITGYVIASEPCRELEVDSISETEYGDVVDLELVRSDSELCAQMITPLKYTVELEYEDEDEVTDVLVQMPDGEVDP